jgi:hypothetical protein
LIVYRPKALEFFDLRRSWPWLDDTKSRRATELCAFAGLLGSKGLSRFVRISDDNLGYLILKVSFEKSMPS